MRICISLYPLIYSLSADFPKDRSQLRCWADKAVDVEGLFEIARSLPKSKLIFITRDPRGTIASMTLQTVTSRVMTTRAGPRRTALIRSAIYWRHLMQSFLLFAKRYPDRYMFVRYEDFVENAEETINSMIAFGAGERMSPEVIECRAFSNFSSAESTIAVMSEAVSTEVPGALAQNAHG